MVASVASSVNSGDIARFDSFAFPHYRRCACISYFILRYCLLFILNGKQYAASRLLSLLWRLSPPKIHTYACHHPQPRLLYG